jgi:hypothetical protein
MKTFRGENVTSFMLGLAIFGAAHGVSLAARLDPSGWIVQQVGASGQPAPPTGLRIGQDVSGQTNLLTVTTPTGGQSNWWQVLFDNNPATMVTMTNFAALTNVPGLLIDMGQTNAIDRVVICGTNNGLKMWSNPLATNVPLGLIVAYVGTTPQTMTEVAEFTVPYDAGNPIDTGMDMRFSPVVGRYVEVQLQTRVSWGVQHWPGYAPNFQSQLVDTAWNVGEMEVYGSTNTQTNINAVVLETNAPAPLVLAANDLSYYIGELTGVACPIITPAQTNGYTGSLYWVNDLASLATNYMEMTNNMATGILPTNEVNVIETNGNVVLFSAWPYRCVVWSVWEFLERQGVRWVYPDIHGDSVPTGNGINLDILPLSYAASAKSIYANWPVTDFQPWPTWDLQSTRQEYLYAWRNRWNNSWNASPLGGAEIPAEPATGITLNSNYVEGFAGYPHNFNTVVPARILSLYSNWWGWPATTTPPTNENQTVFNMCSANLISWVAGKVIGYDASHPLATRIPLNNNHINRAYNLLPMDACLFSSDSNSLAANTLYDQPYPNSLPWIYKYGGYSWAGAYYQFISSVANMATNQLIGGLAYADVFQPPTVSYPSNVQMEVCLYGSPNLPMSSPVNAAMKQAFDTWHTNCSRLATYDYALLHTDYWQQSPLLPVPMVSAFVNTAQYLAGIGALDGGCQATIGSIRYNPWNFYAYPRIRWNTNQTASQLLTEFFNGYYKEAAAPMLAYYYAMENYQYSNNADLHFHGYCYWANPGTFPRFVLNQMQTNLLAAQSMATNWFVINRVNDATNCFNWLTLNLGITNLSALTNFSSFATVPANGTYTVILTNMYPTPMPAGYWYPSGSSQPFGVGNGWNLAGATRIQQTLNFLKAGTYKVDVLTSRNDVNAKPPTMDVYLGTSSGSQSWSTWPIQTNTFDVSISSATAWDLVVDQSNPSGEMNVYQIQITPQ